jgi:hypothetical protein
LKIACDHDQLDLIYYFIGQDCDNLEPAITYACTNNDLELINTIINNGINRHMPFVKYFHKNFDLTAVQNLISKLHFDEFHEVLDYLCQHNSFQILEILIRKKIYPKAHSESLYEYVCHAWKIGKIKTIQFILEKFHFQFRVDLFLIPSKNNSRIIKFFVNNYNFDFEFALRLAHYQNRKKLIRILMRKLGVLRVSSFIDHSIPALLISLGYKKSFQHYLDEKITQINQVKKILISDLSGELRRYLQY